MRQEDLKQIQRIELNGRQVSHVTEIRTELCHTSGVNQQNRVSVQVGRSKLVADGECNLLRVRVGGLVNADDCEWTGNADFTGRFVLSSKQVKSCVGSIFVCFELTASGENSHKRLGRGRSG